MSSLTSPLIISFTVSDSCRGDFHSRLRVFFRAGRAPLVIDMVNPATAAEHPEVCHCLPTAFPTAFPAALPLTFPLTIVTALQVVSGLTLSAIEGDSVKGWSYDATKAAIQAAPRPVTLTFVKANVSNDAAGCDFLLQCPLPRATRLAAPRPCQRTTIVHPANMDDPLTLWPESPAL